MKKSRIVAIVLGIFCGVLLFHAVFAFCGVGLFYRIFYARYDTFCPTDLTVNDLHVPAEPVAFDAYGNTLNGLLIGDGNKGVIVIAHGMRSGMDAHFAEAEYFAENGYTAFVFDGTGTRTSEGDSRRSVSFARDDLEAALDWLASSKYAGFPVFLYGHSSGGYAAAALLERADAAAILCAFDDPIDTMCDTAVPYVGYLSELQRPFLALWNRIEAGADANESASARINETDVPVLIVGASGDTVIPDDDSLYLHADAITDPNATCLLWDGGHSDLWLSPDALSYRAAVADSAVETIDRARYNGVDPAFLDAVLAFFDACL